MAEFISKAAIVTHIEEQSRRWGEEYDAEQILGDIDDFPVADVVERKIGKWYGNKRHQRCSLCGITYCVPDGESGEIDMSDYHYCPNCGAKMEDDDDGRT